MGTKYDGKKKCWIAWYSKRHPITRQPISLRRLNFKSKAEAKRAEARLIIEIEDKFREVVIPTWKQLVFSFEENMVERGLMLKTIETYIVCLKAHTFEDWGSRLIDSITTQEIRELVKLKLGHRSQSSQRNLLKHIRCAFRYGVDVGHISRDPTPVMKFRLGDKLKNVLTVDQVGILLNKAKAYDVEWYPHWCVAVYTGMRSGELYALTWDKVNLEDRRIIVDSSWNSKDGFKDTKSGDDRMIEISPSLLPVLKELKVLSAGCNFVLPRITKWDKGEQARELRMFLTGLGLPSVRFHDLRATWATIMLTKGVEPIKVMIMGGWKDLKTMQRYVRKAGVDIKGITDNLQLHQPCRNDSQVLSFQGSGSN